MQPIDPNSLFNIFEQGDEQVYKEHGMENTLDNPFVLMGMVLRGVENYTIMDNMYLNRYPEQYKKVRKLTKYKYMNRLYSYLEKIKSTNFDDVYSIGESFDTNYIDFGLNYLRIYYEKLEQYEKCAVIKRFVDLLHSAKPKVLI